jgi:hypothetical protein
VTATLPGSDAPAAAAADEGETGSTSTPTSADEARRHDRWLALAVAVVGLPLLWMGYGVDVDVANVLDTTALIRSGDYMPSRTPGVPVFEVIVTLLDPVGGHILVNLATLAAAAATVVGLARLVRAWGHDNDDLVALAFFASPVTIISSTGVADFIWALVFFVWGALFHLRTGTSTSSTTDDGDGEGRGGWLAGREGLVAGVLFALSIGSRMSTGFLIAAFLVADGWDPANRRRCVRTALVAAPLGALMYVPSWLAFDRSLQFLQNSEGYRSFGNNLGRFVYKNYATAGPVLLVVLLVAVPALVTALRHWGRDPMLRFGALAFAVSQGLYFMMPWKAAHLLPALFALVLWVGASARNRRPFLWVLIAALAVNGLFSVRLLSPDRPGEAQGGSWDPALGVGWLVNDVRCRLDVMDETPQSYQEDAWACALKPMRGTVPPGSDPDI